MRYRDRAICLRSYMDNLLVLTFEQCIVIQIIWNNEYCYYNR